MILKDPFITISLQNIVAICGKKSIVPSYNLMASSHSLKELLAIIV